MNRKDKDKDKKSQEPQEQDAAASQPDADAQEAGGAENADEAAQSPEAALESLRRERDDLEHKLLRTAADYQNYAKRAEQNLKIAQQQQLMELAKGLVTVLDHFDNALAVDPEQTSAKDVLSGVQIVRDELLRTLQRFGIERLDIQPGEAFDPNRHEAMMRESREDIETNHVTQQLQPGYVLDEKVIRPAKVGVAE